MDMSSHAGRDDIECVQGREAMFKIRISGDFPRWTTLRILQGLRFAVGAPGGMNEVAN